MQRWLIAYDIPDDRRRNRTARVLDDFGDRVQESVFEVLADEECIRALLLDLKSIIDVKEDKVRAYPLCDSCARKIIDLGRTDEPPFHQPEVIIV